MTEPKLITLPIDKVILIELPERATDPRIDKGYLWYDDNNFTCVIAPVHLSQKYKWRIIGMLSEVREEQIVDIIDSVSVICADGTEYRGWRNYVYRDDFDESILLKTALESLDSAILAEGYAWNNPYGTNTLYYTDKFTGEKKVRVDWAELQSRILCRERCLLLGREG